MPAATVPVNTTGAPAAQTKSALSGRPARGRMVVPGMGGPGLKRNERVTCFHRWISRYMVRQLHIHAMALITATTQPADGLLGLTGLSFLRSRPRRQVAWRCP